MSDENRKDDAAANKKAAAVGPPPANPAKRDAFAYWSDAKLDAANGDVAGLSARLDRVNLVMQTLLRLMIEKGVTNEEEFRQWLQYMDQQDGSVDGKIRPNPTPRDCPSCGRVNRPNALKCQYCGEKFPIQVFDIDPAGRKG